MVSSVYADRKELQDDYERQIRGYTRQIDLLTVLRTWIAYWWKRFSTPKTECWARKLTGIQGLPFKSHTS